MFFYTTPEVKTVDKLELRIDSADKLQEQWVLDDYDSDEIPHIRLVRIFINGQDLKKIVTDIEKPYMIESGCSPDDADYSHNTVERMKFQFEQLSDETSYSSKYGIELFCCPDCGVGGCWSVMCHFRAENDVVYMERFYHNHRDWKYDLSYCFTRENFEAEIQKLK